jgi:hypothetical protein
MSKLQRLSELLQSDKVTRTTLVDDTGVILHLDSLQVLTLNETGMFLVDRIGEGMSSVEQLITALSEEFEVDEATARGDIEPFLDELERLLTP